MMLYVRTALSIIAMFAMAAVAQAQDNRQALAEQLVEETGASQRIIQSVEATSPLIIQSFRSSYPDLTEPEGDLIVGYFVDELRVLLPQFMTEISGLYAENFTEDELEQLLAFYRSPVGQRFTEFQPEIIVQSEALALALSEQAMMNALPQIQSLLETR